MVNEIYIFFMTELYLKFVKFILTYNPVKDGKIPTRKGFVNVYQ